MAYRRRQGLSRASTFQEEIHQKPLSDSGENGTIHPSHPHSRPSTLSSSFSFTPTSSSSSSLAAQAIKASAARCDPSHSFAYSNKTSFASEHHRSKSCDAYGDGLGRGDSKSGFWGVLAQKAKEILDDENSSSPQHDIMSQKLKSHSFNAFSPVARAQFKPLYQHPDSHRKIDNPTFRKGLDAITSSLNQLGDSFENAFEDGRTIVESKITDLRTQVKQKEESNQASGMGNPMQQSALTANFPTIHETQLKASRDVAMATAAKAKLLLRELKTVKADLAFAKARCAQLEEENKLLRDREGREKGQNRADDDLIRLQLETLLAEKARLANENETYSRENRFLREIVEYHQLTMQDVVYVDEGMEEVAELYPMAHMDTTTVPRIMSISTCSPLGARGAVHSKPIFPVPQELEEEDEQDIDDDEDKNTSEDEAPPRISVSENHYAK